jgi:hypothetical protein
VLPLLLSRLMTRPRASWVVTVPALSAADIPVRVVVGSLLRRGRAGHQSEREQGE